jgi:hypothetical protein
MNDKFDGATVLGAAIVLSVIAGIALAFYPGWPAIYGALKGGEAPAWVQAIGSVAAIWFSTAMARRQIAAAAVLEARKRHIDDLGRTEVVRQMFLQADAAVANVHDVIHKPMGMIQGWAFSELEDAARAIGGLPVLSIPGEGMAIGVTRIPRVLLEYREVAETMFKALIESRRALYQSVSVPTRLQVAYDELFSKASTLCSIGVMSANQQVRQLKELAGVKD